jgi:hypothetical protein
MREAKINYDQYLESGETTDPTKVGDGVVLVKPATLRKRKERFEQNLTPEELERLEEERVTRAQDHATMKRLDLRYWGESRFGHGADIAAEEIEIHRLFLRSLGQPDVQPGETLRQLAKRTLIAYFDGTSLFRADKKTFPIKQYGQGGSVGVPAFNPTTQKFTFEGFRIPNGGAPDWFERDWRVPSDCTGDEEIDIESLPALPDELLRRKQ